MTTGLRNDNGRSVIPGAFPCHPEPLPCHPELAEGSLFYPSSQSRSKARNLAALEMTMGLRNDNGIFCRLKWRFNPPQGQIAKAAQLFEVFRGNELHLHCKACLSDSIVDKRPGVKVLIDRCSNFLISRVFRLNSPWPIPFTTRAMAPTSCWKSSRTHGSC